MSFGFQQGFPILYRKIPPIDGKPNNPSLGAIVPDFLGQNNNLLICNIQNERIREPSVLIRTFYP